MKNRNMILTLVAMFTLGLGVSVAQVDPFMPLMPATLGRGGSYTANAGGFDAFFYNPAGFAGDGEFTLLSTSLYTVMDSKLFDALRIAAFTGDSSGLLGKSAVESRADGLPPEFTALLGQFSDISSYLGDAFDQSPGEFKSIVEPQLTGSGLVLDGVDLTSINSPEDVFAVLDMAAILKNPAQLEALLAGIMTSIDGNVAFTSSGTPPDISRLSDAFDDALASAASSLPKGNLDLGVTLGTGWVGNGLGLGAFVQAFAVVRTPDKVGSRPGTILDASGRVFTIITMEGGMGFEVSDEFSWGVGLRPTVLGVGDLSTSGILSLLSNIPTDPFVMVDLLVPQGFYKSFYVGLDAGFLWDISKEITLGVAVKDIIPWRLRYYAFDGAASYIQSLPFQFGSNAVPESERDGLYYIPPMKVNLGIAWHPDMGSMKFLFDPEIGVDIFDLFGFVRYLAALRHPDPSLIDAEFNLLDMIGIGANARFFEILDVQLGVYKGGLTAGAGIDFGIGELNVAWLARGLDISSQAAFMRGFTETGLSAEFAFRF